MKIGNGYISGEAGTELTAEHAYRAGRIAGYLFGTKSAGCKAVIGKDTRRSSYMLEYALCAGLIASGADAYIMHVTTSPSVAFTVSRDSFDCGIMISGGTNPWYENGIHFLDKDGKCLDGGSIERIAEFIGKNTELPLATGRKVGRTVDYVSGRNRYIAHLISLSECSYKRLKIGIDAANGSAWQIADSVFSALGAKTFMLGNCPDGTNVNEGAGLAHTEKLTELVKREKLDIGFSFDGDARGCVAVDERGAAMPHSEILKICKGLRICRGETNEEELSDGLVAALTVTEALVESKCRASHLVFACPKIKHAYMGMY